jgi:hypothetical protein
MPSQKKDESLNLLLAKNSSTVNYKFCVLLKVYHSIIVRAIQPFWVDTTNFFGTTNNLCAILPQNRDKLNNEEFYIFNIFAVCKSTIFAR